MINPTPIDIDIETWASITESTQKEHKIGARTINQFIQTIEHLYSTSKNNENTNIVDQGEKKTYSLPNDKLIELFHYLNICKNENTIMHFSERQIDPCGFMLDFDIISSEKKIELSEWHCHKLTSLLFKTLQDDLIITNQEHYIFYTVRNTVDFCEKNKYKFGFHILIPGIKLDKIYKKLFLNKIKNNQILLSVLNNLHALHPENCLDLNSASVPVLFLGSSKLGHIPYTLKHVSKILIEENDILTAPFIKNINIDELNDYNLIFEMSLNFEACYESAVPLIKKIQYCYKNHILNEINKLKDDKNNIKEDNYEEDDSLSILTIHNPEAKYLHALLDILSEEYYTDRNKWRNVIYALANSSDQYKTLAIWFSKKCPNKWLEHGMEELEKLWNEIVINKMDKPLSISSISYWAKISNIEKYNLIMQRSYFTILTKFVYEHKGKLQHYMIAKVLHAMLHSKFCVDVGTRTKKYNWYEFVLPGQTMKMGEVWKWRKEIEPDNIHIYISEKLTKVIENINDYMEEQKKNSTSDSQTKYYNNLIKALLGSKNNMFNDTFKNGIIKQAVYIFRRRGFTEQLDTTPDLFGVGNGVLQLGSTCKLIDTYHEYPISMYTEIIWKSFDETNEYTKFALGAIADIVIEPDVRNWILFHAAQGLSRENKEGLLLLFEGGGQNGKTSLLRWIAKALGPYADKFNIQLLSCDKEEADKPNSAMMKFKHINWAYAEESNKAQVLNVARMKELVNAGEISSRELNSKQETFTIKCNFVVASQYSFIINTNDHGTWRRLKHYTSKVKFCSHPDPLNPFEKKDNQDFNLKYSSDPNFISSILSILSHYYERLQKEYKGELKNVPCPKLDIETESFRVSQDAIHRWVCEALVLSPDCGYDYDIATITNHYSEWYKIHIDRNKSNITSTIFQKDLMSSAISKYLKPSINGTIILKGCRLLNNDLKIRENESYISIKKSFKTDEEYDIRSDWWNHHF